MIKVNSVIKVACTACTGFAISYTASASGLEYSKQSILPFFEEGNHAELTYAYVDIDIEGTDVAGMDAEGNLDKTKINDVDNMMDDFRLLGGAIKVAPTDSTALAVIYDEPFGVDTKYQKGSDFSNSMGTTEARVDTKSLTVLGGGKVVDNVWLYGGIEAQEAKGFVTLAQQFDGNPIYYDLQTEDESHSFNPVLGVAYEIPDIMLRAALTWRGEGEHDFDAHESLLIDNSLLNSVLKTQGPTDYNDIPPAIKGAIDLPEVGFGNTKLSFKTPQSVNLDFQTGLSEEYQLLGMVNARWVEWSAFEIAPSAITKVVGEPLAEYKKNAYAVEVALGKQFTPKFSGEVRVGYDSGTGEPLSLLGPYDSVQTLALGGNYDINKALSVSAGAQYMRFEGGKAYSELPIDETLAQRAIANFDDGDGYAVGMKLAYSF